MTTKRTTYEYECEVCFQYTKNRKCTKCRSISYSKLTYEIEEKEKLNKYGMAVFVFPDKTTILIKRKDDSYHYPGSNCNQAAKSMTVTNIINNLTQDFKNMNFENIDKLEMFTYLN